MENNVIVKNENTPSINKIKYNGIVTVAIKKRDRIISKKTFHNQGGMELFKFLCKCLESSSDAENYRPINIKLFNNDSATPETASEGTLTSMCESIAANEIHAVYDTLPDESSTDKTWYTTFHFTIPNSSINTNSKTTINEMRLYSKTANVDGLNTDYDNYCADFKFTKEEGTQILWDPITINSNKKNSYNLIISWSLSFTN